MFEAIKFPEYIKVERLVTGTPTNGTWEDVSSYVVSDISGEQGMYNNAYDNRLASAGNCLFDLDNASGYFDDLEEGQYFRVLTKWNFKEVQVFIGRLQEPIEDNGTWGDQRIHIELLDWMDDAQRDTIPVKEAETGKIISEAATSLLSSASIQPNETEFDDGDNTFPFVFDDLKDRSTIYSELNSLVMSELGYGYLKEGGGVLRIEAGSARETVTLERYSSIDEDDILLQVSDPTSYISLADGSPIQLHQTGEIIFDNSFKDLKTKKGGNVINHASVTVYPRDYPTGTSVDLYTFNAYETADPIFIPSGTTIVLRGGYTEPYNGKIPDGMQSLFGYGVICYEFPNGDGEFISLITDLVAGGNSWVFTASNTAPGETKDGYLIQLGIDGVPIFKQSPIEQISEDTASQEEFSLKSFSLKQPYKDSPIEGKAFIDRIIAAESEPRRIAERAIFDANISTINMAGFFFVDLGSAIRIKSNKPSLDQYFFIQGRRFKLYLGRGWIEYELILSKPVSIS